MSPVSRRLLPRGRRAGRWRPAAVIGWVVLGIATSAAATEPSGGCPAGGDAPLTVAYEMINTGRGMCAVALLEPLREARSLKAEERAAVLYNLARAYEVSARWLGAAEAYLDVLSLERGLPRPVRAAAWTSLRQMFAIDAESRPFDQRHLLDLERLDRLIARSTDPALTVGLKLTLAWQYRLHQRNLAAVGVYRDILADRQSTLAAREAAQDGLKEAQAALSGLRLTCPDGGYRAVRATVDGPIGRSHRAMVNTICGGDMISLDHGTYAVVLWSEAPEIGSRRYRVDLKMGQQGVLPYSLPQKEVGLGIGPFLSIAGVGAATAAVGLIVGDGNEAGQAVGMVGVGIAVSSLVTMLVSEAVQSSQRNWLVVEP